MAYGDLNTDALFKLPGERDLGDINNLSFGNWGGGSSSILNTLGGGDSKSTPQWKIDLFGGTNADGSKVAGSLPTGIGAFTGLASAYLGWQQFNLAKDQMEQNKKIFNLNFGAQAQSTNRELEDRQNRRFQNSGGRTESAQSYMERNRVNVKGI